MSVTRKMRNNSTKFEVSTSFRSCSGLTVRTGRTNRQTDGQYHCVIRPP